MTGDLRRDHWCGEDIGLNASCGEEAYDLRGGFWMCQRHVDRYDFDVYASSVLADQPEDWDTERAQADAEGQRRYEQWRETRLADEPDADVSEEAYADDLLTEYEASEDDALHRGIWGIWRR